MLATAAKRIGWALAACLALVADGLQQTHAQVGLGAETVPSQAYYGGIEELYQGNYRDAIRIFSRETRSGIQTVNARFVDSVCYYAMLGEAYYHAGQIEAALREFDVACSLILQYPNWLLRVRFENTLRADAAVARRQAPWGASGRGGLPGSFSRTMLYSQGQVDNSGVVAQGGVVNPARFWQLDVVEVLRASALAVYRRNEILGPLAQYDKISTDLARVFAQRGAPPNHWSGAWVDIERGIALAGIGNREQALQYLERGMLVAGRFDHPLTSIALLVEGRLAMEAGDVAEADRLLAEASFSAFQFEDVRVIDEAFRLAARNRMASGAGGVNPAWDPAAAWARRERFDHVYARVQLAAAEELIASGDPSTAAVAVKEAQSRGRDARAGLLGITAGFLDAHLQFLAGRDSAYNAMAKVIAAQSAVSLRNFQIARTNAMFDVQALQSRPALELYELLLGDPTDADIALDLLDAIAYMRTPNAPAFDRWLSATLSRNNVAASIAVADLAKRRRFLQQLPWGGRLEALRLAAVAPEVATDPEAIQRRRDLRARLPALSAALGAEDAVEDQIDALWTPSITDDQKQSLTRLWKDLDRAITVREYEVASAALTRVPAPYAFPPIASLDAIKQQLAPGHAVLMFHDTPEGLLGMLLTAQASTQWSCGPSNRVGGVITEFLRELGNYDANRELTTDQLADDGWRETSRKLYSVLFEGSSLSPAQTKELIIIPDGATWYVPFEALWVDTEDGEGPLAATVRVRYAPTLALAFRHAEPWRRVRRTGVIVGDLPPGDDAELRAAAAEPIEAAVDNPVALTDALQASSPLAASVLDSLVVLADVETSASEPLAWNPAPIPGSRRGELGDWLLLAGGGPQRIAIPGMHTLAETGGRASRRRGAVPGDELFNASCTLMSAGAETMLLSRWRVGGQSTLQAVRDFIQETPHASAAEAWQRSVQLLMETPIDPLAELRVKAGKDVVEATGAHPFFWGGYLVVDSGWRPPPAETPDGVDGRAPAADPAAPPDLPGGAAPPPRPTPPAEAARPEGVETEIEMDEVDDADG